MDHHLQTHEQDEHKIPIDVGEFEQYIMDKILKRKSNSE